METKSEKSYMSIFLRNRHIAIVAAMFLCTLPAAAEAMDKVPAIRVVWFWALAGVLAGALLPMYRWWLVFVSLPFSVFFPLGMVIGCHESFLGPAIRHEAGASYIWQCHLALCLVVIANLCGVAFYFVGAYVVRRLG